MFGITIVSDPDFYDIATGLMSADIQWLLTGQTPIRISRMNGGC